MPVLMIAFVLSDKDDVAMYRNGTFLPRLKDIDVESMAKDPTDIQLRWMDLSGASRRLLMGLVEIARAFGAANSVAELEPFEVAKALVAIFDGLQPWTKRTVKEQNERGEAIFWPLGDLMHSIKSFTAKDRKSTRLNSSHGGISRMPSSA